MGKTKKLILLLLSIFLLTSCSNANKSYSKPNKDIIDRLFTMQNKYSKLNSINAVYTFNFKGILPEEVNSAEPLELNAKIDASMIREPLQMKALTTFSSNQKDIKSLNSEIILHETNNQLQLFTKLNEDKFKLNEIDKQYVTKKMIVVPSFEQSQEFLKLILSDSEHIFDQGVLKVIEDVETTEIGVDVTIGTLKKMIALLPSDENDAKNLLEQLPSDVVISKVYLNITEGNELKRIFLDFSDLTSLLRGFGLKIDVLNLEAIFNDYDHVQPFAIPNDYEKDDSFKLPNNNQ